MALLRPGEFAITDRGIEMAALSKGSKVLDIGCGEGDTIIHLQEDLGMTAEGIDINLARISEAKEKHPGIDVKFGDGEFLDGYMSYTFDGILMECSLSLINMPDEALHEAYCVMKKGGKLIISDLYEIDPDPEQMRAVRMEANRVAKIPHQEGDCDERGMKFVDFRFGGAFYREPLIRQLESIGFHVLGFEDRTEDLNNYVAQAVMDGEEGQGLEGLCPNLELETGGRKRKIGYFVLAAAKPL